MKIPALSVGVTVTQGYWLLDAGAVLGYLILALAVLVVLAPIVRRTASALARVTKGAFASPDGAEEPSSPTQEPRTIAGVSARVWGFFVAAALLSLLLGTYLGTQNVYGLMWFRNSGSAPAILVFFAIMWVAPFVAPWLLFGSSVFRRLLSYPLFFLSSYLWSWLIAHWDSVRAG